MFHIPAYVALDPMAQFFIMGMLVVQIIMYYQKEDYGKLHILYSLEQFIIVQFKDYPLPLDWPFKISTPILFLAKVIYFF